MTRRLRAASLTLLALALGGCPAGEAEAPPGPAPTTVPAPATAPLPCLCPPAPGGGLPTDSLDHLEGRWTDSAGASRTMADLGGRTRVVAMVFTHCGFACPRTLADLKGIEAAMAPARRAEVGFVLASFDTARDTPARLAAWGAENSLDPARWTLLHGQAGEVRELAAALGVQYEPAGEDFAHSNLIIVLNRRGQVAFRLEGLGADPARLLEVLARCPH